MESIICKTDYEKLTAATRDARMEWWRSARFGLFIHYGLYAQLGRNEWVRALEAIPQDEYERLANSFSPKKDVAMEWAKTACDAGMKYAVLTTRHHEGFSLWNSKVNPFNSVNLGPHRDIVGEFVEACHKYNLKIGFYSSLMDWHHPDGWRCAFDNEARRRFTQYIEALNTELLTQYGKIDILWYDVAQPLESWEGWDSLVRNQHMRKLQPDIIINNRSKLDEDFGTPEGSINPEHRDWEACMTFNDISWGYVDDEQTKPYAYSAQRIVKMLNNCANKGGNLLLNIGPRADGSIPQDAIDPLEKVGKWLEQNCDAVYGKHSTPDDDCWAAFRNGVCGVTISADRKHVYLWNWIWPKDGTMALGGFYTAPKSVHVLANGEPINFKYERGRIILNELKSASPDKLLGIAVIDIEFEDIPEYHTFGFFPQYRKGEYYP